MKEAEMEGKFEITNLRFVLLVLVLQFLVWPEIIVGSKALCFRDYGFFGYPIAQFHRDAFWVGRIPHWNPYNDCGVPFLAQWNTLVLYPGSVIYLLLPLPLSLGYFCLAHQTLAAVGMFQFCRAWAGSANGAALAGVAFAFGSFALNCVHWPNNIAALGWMPWVVISLGIIVREGWRSRRSWLALLVCSLQMLTGAPELILMTWFIGGILSLVHAGSGKVWNGVFRLIGAALFTVLLCSIQLLPFFGFLPFSQRDSGFGGAEWSMPPLGFGGFLSPFFQSYLSIQGVPLQHGQYWITGYYQGLLTVLFGVLALGQLFKGKSRLVMAAAGLVLFGFWMAMGDSGLLYKGFRQMFPQLGWMRFPIKWVIVPCFLIPFLASVGFAVSENDRSKAGGIRLCWIALALFGTTVGLGILDLYFPLMRSGTSFTERTISTLSLQAVLLVAGVGLFLFQTRGFGPRVDPLRSGCVFAVCGLVAWDALQSFPRSRIHVPPEVFSSAKPGPSLKAAAGTERLMLGREAILSYMKVSLDDPQATFLVKRAGMFANANLIDGAAKVDGFFSLTPRWSAEVVEALFARQDPRPLPLMDFLCVRQFSLKPHEWETLRHGRITNWVWGVSRVDASTNLDQVIRRGWDPWREAWIEPAWDAANEATGGGVVDAAVTVLASSFHSERVEAALRVQGGVAGMTTLAMSWHPGWQATVDGVTARVWRVNHGFMGVRVKSGDHRVVWEFRDPWWVRGCWTTAISLAGWAVGFFCAKRGSGFTLFPTNGSAGC